MSFVTFIVPTIGRSTLNRTLGSLLAQTDRDWTALVLADGLPKFKPVCHDPRIFYLPMAEKVGLSNNGFHCSGFVRNWGVALAVSEWCAFVDDDDRLSPSYVRHLRSESPGMDLVVFRMAYQPARSDGAMILPRTNRVAGLGPGEVGISFAVRSQFQHRQEVWFGMEEFEDWFFIKNCLDRGAACKVSDAVLYYVRH